MMVQDTAVLKHCGTWDKYRDDAKTKFSVFIYKSTILMYTATYDKRLPQMWPFRIWDFFLKHIWCVSPRENPSWRWAWQAGHDMPIASVIVRLHECEGDSWALSQSVCENPWAGSEEVVQHLPAPSWILLHLHKFFQHIQKPSAVSCRWATIFMDICEFSRALADAIWPLQGLRHTLQLRSTKKPVSCAHAHVTTL